MKPAGEKYTVAVDFDGVIHRYDSPWVAAHVIPDGPVDGAIRWLCQMLHDGFHVVIFSTRCRTWRGRRAILRWLKVQGMGDGYRERIRLTYEKPPALVYLDDRAMRFTGTFPTASEIHNARPWNRPRKAPNAEVHAAETPVTSTEEATP